VHTFPSLGSAWSRQASGSLLGGTARQLSEWQEIGRRNSKLDADLSNPSAWDDVCAPPVEDSGAGTAETDTERAGAPSLVDQGLHSEQLSRHAVQCRLSRRGVSSLYVGTIDAPMRRPRQTVFVSDLKSIGSRISDLRRAEGISQEELGAAIGVSRSTIAGIETGGDRSGIETAIAIADYYKVSLDWLLGRHIPSGRAPVGKLVYRPDQIAILDYWDSLAFEEKKALFKLLRVTLPDETK